MLYARCLSRAARRIASDIMVGLHTADELVDSLPKQDKEYNRNSNGYIDVDISDSLEHEEGTTRDEDELSNLDTPFEETN